MKMKSVLMGLLLGLMQQTTALADTPSVHGMLLFGNQKTYASHLPMFHAPHDYQVILELSLVDLPRSQTTQYYQQAKKSGNTFFTIEPVTMDLTQVISGEKSSFNAKIYVGHFERGGQPLGWVQVHVEKVIYAKKLEGAQPAHDFQQYLLFGIESEYFGAHIIKSRPSFDSVFSVSKKPATYFNGCRTRLCNGPEPFPRLPVIVTDWHTTGIDQLPEAGKKIGNPIDGETVVKEVLYEEVGELQ